VAALATICNVPGLLERLCVKRDEEVGVYGFIFFKDGDWVSTVVDDQLFYTTDYRSFKRSLYFSTCSEERETWLPLMEKAYAKIHGEYVYRVVSSDTSPRWLCLLKPCSFCLYLP